MVIKVVIKVPAAESMDDMDYLHTAARRLSEQTSSGNVEFRESKMFQPVGDDGDGGNNWKTFIIEAKCPASKFDESKVRSTHTMLVNNIVVPDDVAIETEVESKNIYLLG